MTQHTPRIHAVSTDESAFIAEVLTAEAGAIGRIAERVQERDTDNWRAAIDLLDDCTGHVVVSGMGKSGLVEIDTSGGNATVTGDLEIWLQASADRVNSAD